MTLSLVNPWMEQPQTASPNLRDWQFIQAGGASYGLPLSRGTQQLTAYADSQAILINAGQQVTTGAMVPGISDAITVVMIASKVSNIITNSDFLFGEHQAAAGVYNYGFYESISTGNLVFYLTNASASAVIVGGANALWIPSSKINVYTCTYGGGDNNLRMYLDGVEIYSAVQTGTIRRHALGLLQSCFWQTSTPNFKLYGFAVSNRRLNASEVASNFCNISSAWGALFTSQQTPAPIPTVSPSNNRIISLPAGYKKDADNTEYAFNHDTPKRPVTTPVQLKQLPTVDWSGLTFLWSADKLEVNQATNERYTSVLGNLPSQVVTVKGVGASFNNTKLLFKTRSPLTNNANRTAYCYLLVATFTPTSGAISMITGTSYVAGGVHIYCHPDSTLHFFSSGWADNATGIALVPGNLTTVVVGINTEPSGPQNYVFVHDHVTGAVAGYLANGQHSFEGDGIAHVGGYVDYNYNGTVVNVAHFVNVSISRNVLLSLAKDPWQLFTPNRKPEPIPANPRPFIKTTRKSEKVMESQPQFATSIVSNSTMQEGLVRLFNFSSLADSVAGDTLSSTTNPMIGTNIAGNGLIIDYTVPRSYRWGKRGIETLTTAATIVYFGSFSAITDNGGVFGIGDGAWQQFYLGTQWSTKAILAGARIGGFVEITTGSTSLETNRPVLMAGVYNGTTLNTFVNGVLESSRTCPGTLNQDSSHIFHLGMGTSNRSIGIANIGAVWNRALSEVEIAALAKNPWQLFNNRIQTPDVTQSSDTGIIVPPYLSNPGVSNIVSATGTPIVRAEY